MGRDGAEESSGGGPADVDDDSVTDGTTPPLPAQPSSVVARRAATTSVLRLLLLLTLSLSASAVAVMVMVVKSLPTSSLLLVDAAVSTSSWDDLTSSDNDVWTAEQWNGRQQRRRRVRRGGRKRRRWTQEDRIPRQGEISGRRRRTRRALSSDDQDSVDSRGNEDDREESGVDGGGEGPATVTNVTVASLDVPVAPPSSSSSTRPAPPPPDPTRAPVKSMDEPIMPDMTTMRTVTYPPEAPFSRHILNPERGWYVQYTYHATSPRRLDLSTLSDLRLKRGITLILRLYYINDEYMCQEMLTDDFLEDVAADLQVVRDAGIKMILRFAYSDHYHPHPRSTMNSTSADYIAYDNDVSPSSHSRTNSSYDGEGDDNGVDGDGHDGGDDTPSSSSSNDGAAAPPPPHEYPLDPTPEIVMRHISQLSPLLQSNHDVIFLLQAGFVGAYGEWAFTSHYGDVSHEDWVDRGAVLRALLDAVPSERKVAVRTPREKRMLLGLGIEEGVDNPTDSDRNDRDGNGAGGKEVDDDDVVRRVGHHDDCFLSSPRYETYNVSADYPYLQSDAKHTGMGGETCEVYPPRSHCDNALVEMGRFSFTYLNADYHPDVLRSWSDDGNIEGDAEGDGINEEGKVGEGCTEEVGARLGYRLVLRKGKFSSSVTRSGGTLHYELTLENVGFAAPLNGRSVQLVLRGLEPAMGGVDNTGGGGSNRGVHVCVATLPDDPRHWIPGDVVVMSGSARLPAGEDDGASEGVPHPPTGTYELLLNLADPTPSLMNRVEYRMGVANDHVVLGEGSNVGAPPQSMSMNEIGTGLTKLMHTVKIMNAKEVVASGQDLDDDIFSFICGDVAADAVLPRATAQMLPARPYLSNGDFEGDEGAVRESWSNYGLDGFFVSTEVKRSGSRSVGVMDGAALTIVTLDAPAGSVVAISGYSKLIFMDAPEAASSSSASSSPSPDYSLYADVTYEDGTTLSGRVATFPPSCGTSTMCNWEYVEMSFVLEKTASTVALYAMHRTTGGIEDDEDDIVGRGVAYFDDLRLLVDGDDAPPVSCPDGYYHHRTSADGEDGDREDYCVWCPPGYACDPLRLGGREACGTSTYSTGGTSLSEGCTPCPGCHGRDVCSVVSGLCICQEEGWVGPFCSSSSSSSAMEGIDEDRM